MLYTFITSYLYDLVVMVWQPVPLFPLPIVVSGGVLSEIGGISGNVQFTLYAAAIVHFAMGMAQAIVYRYAQVSSGVD